MWVSELDIYVEQTSQLMGHKTTTLECSNVNESKIQYSNYYINILLDFISRI